MRTAGEAQEWISRQAFDFRMGRAAYPWGHLPEEARQAVDYLEERLVMVDAGYGPAIVAELAHHNHELASQLDRERRQSRARMERMIADIVALYPLPPSTILRRET